MKEARVPISKVDNWDKNPRLIKTKNFNRLKKQITRLGVYKRLICYKENGRYITLGGNQRLLALRDLDHKEVDISIVDPKSEAEKIEISLSDNDRAGEYDDQALAELLYEEKNNIDTELFKLDIGSPISVDYLLQQFGPRIEAGEEDTVPKPEIKPRSKPGELYELGPHRLLCGDATRPENYEALLEGKKADLVFTDPPITAVGINVPVATMGDSMSEEKYVEFAITFIDLMKSNIKKGGVFYLCGGYSNYSILTYALKAAGLTYAGPIVWVKNSTSISRGDYRNKHEMILKAKKGSKKAQAILYGWNGGKHYFFEHKFEADVWEMAKRTSQALLHPAQKPLGLVQRAIRNSSQPNEAVLDPFAGSGSTVIAADREGRTAYLMELDPQYIDVTILRYVAMGGPTEKEIRATVKKVKIPKEKT